LSKIRIFSYLPNPRVWKSLITAKLAGVEIEVIGDKPKELSKWLWDFDARIISDEDKLELDSFKRKGREVLKVIFIKLIVLSKNIHLEQCLQHS